jgi:spoIIIJ-associated protein
VTNERRSQSITVSAKTVAEAIAEAERRLGLPQTEIDITVISEGSKGFLGMGGENARILAMPKAALARRAPATAQTAGHAAPPPPVEAARPAPVEDEAELIEDEEDLLVLSVEAHAAPEQLDRRSTQLPHTAPAPQPVAEDLDLDAEQEPGDEEQASAERMDSSQVADVAVEVVRELLLHMGLDAQATVRSTGNPVVIDITGDELGLLIGRHGETLSSLQYLVNAIVGKRVHRWCKVIIDVEHYRLRREDTLRSMANRQAARVRQSRREIALDPMSAAERRVIHMTLQNNPWVVTNSVGEEPNRRVVIAPRQGAR